MNGSADNNLRQKLKQLSSVSGVKTAEMYSFTCMGLTRDGMSKSIQDLVLWKAKVLIIGYDCGTKLMAEKSLTRMLECCSVSVEENDETQKRT